MFSLSSTHHHWAINIFNTWLMAPAREVTFMNKVSDLTMHGHLVTTPELLQLAQRRNGIASMKENFLLTANFLPVRVMGLNVVFFVVVLS